MTPKEAMLMLIINGLIDKFAKQKALQTVENLFKNESHMEDLCKLATKFVNENIEELNLIGRMQPIKNEPIDQTFIQQTQNENERMEVDVFYSDDLLYLVLKGFESDKV
jgi:hypothetical protein